MEAALFLDVGNIWSLSAEDDREGAGFEFTRFYKELAVGTGVGTRAVFSFLFSGLTWEFPCAILTLWRIQLVTWKCRDIRAGILPSIWPLVIHSDPVDFTNIYSNFVRSF